MFILARWPAGSNRATNVPMDITYAGGTTTVVVNQQSNNNLWVSLGTYSFNAGTSGYVTIRTTGTNGYVMADAVEFSPVTSAGNANGADSAVAAQPTTPAPARGSVKFHRGLDTSVAELRTAMVQIASNDADKAWEEVNAVQWNGNAAASGGSGIASASSDIAVLRDGLATHSAALLKVVQEERGRLHDELAACRDSGDGGWLSALSLSHKHQELHAIDTVLTLVEDPWVDG